MRAARSNFIPGLVLQAFAVSLVIAYYAWPSAQVFCDRLANLKAGWGFTFSMVSTSLFGGVIPYLFMRWHKATRHITPPSHGLFYILFWAYKGLEVDAFYRLQVLVFGDGLDFKTIGSKVLVDQFVYSPLVSAPVIVVLYHWKERGFTFRALRETQWLSYLKSALPSALFSTWAVWVPTVAIIYCLPSSLQIPLFNIVLCFFVLLLASLTRRRE